MKNLLGMILALCTFNSSAGLITQQDLVNNSVVVTYDDNTQLEWLRFDQATNLSIDDLNNANNNNFLAQGWTLASKAQMAKLLNSYFEITFYSELEYLDNINFFAPTMVNSFLDVFGHSYGSGNNKNVQLILGHDENQNGVFNYFYTNNFDANSKQVSLRDDNIWWSPEASYKQSIDGLALVRTVPNAQVNEPAVFSLFMLMLSTMILSRRKKV